MIEALNLMLQAFITLYGKPHKTTQERALVGNLYTQICLFGGQPFRRQMESAKVMANKRLDKPESLHAALVAEKVETNEPPAEKKNPVTSDTQENQKGEPLQKENQVFQAPPVVPADAVVAEKKRGPKPKIKE